MHIKTIFFELIERRNDQRTSSKESSKEFLQMINEAY